MNRDQWSLKMSREAEQHPSADTCTEDPAMRPAAKLADRRAAERRCAAANRQAGLIDLEFATSPVEKYGACCEWELSLKTKKQ